MLRYGEIPRLCPIQPDIRGKFFVHSLCDQSHRCNFKDEGLCGRRDTVPFSLSSIVDGGEQLASRYGRFISGEGISVTHLWTSEPICTS